MRGCVSGLARPWLSTHTTAAANLKMMREGCTDRGEGCTDRGEGCTDPNGSFIIPFLYTGGGGMSKVKKGGQGGGSSVPKLGGAAAAKKPGVGRPKKKREAPKAVVAPVAEVSPKPAVPRE
jgi:hypothetical protein